MRTLSHLGTAPNITPEESRIAALSSRHLANLVRQRQQEPSLSVQFPNENQGAMEVVLPLAAVRLLTQVLEEMAKGHSVTLLPSQTELTTQQAADIIGVSRPYLVELLEKGAIPFRKIGTHRRIQLTDLLHYDTQETERRIQGLTELMTEAQELGLGY